MTHQFASTTISTSGSSQKCHWPVGGWLCAILAVNTYRLDSKDAFFVVFTSYVNNFYNNVSLLQVFVFPLFSALQMVQFASS